MSLLLEGVKHVKEEAIGSSARTDQGQALQHENRKNLYRLDQTLYLLPSEKHPIEMGKEEIEAFLTHLAVDRKVSATAQNLKVKKVNCGAREAPLGD
jgi:hypothetical protein